MEEKNYHNNRRRKITINLSVTSRGRAFISIFGLITGIFLEPFIGKNRYNKLLDWYAKIRKF